MHGLPGLECAIGMPAIGLIGMAFAAKQVIPRVSFLRISAPPKEVSMPQSCPLCHTSAGATATQLVTDDPTVLDRLLGALRERRDGVAAGRLEPRHVQEEVPQLCPGCAGLLGGITGTASREELVQHLELEIRRGEARLDALEQDMPPTAEYRPRLPGPGDRAA